MVRIKTPPLRHRGNARSEVAFPEPGAVAWSAQVSKGKAARLGQEGLPSGRIAKLSANAPRAMPVQGCSRTRQGCEQGDAGPRRRGLRETSGQAAQMPPPYRYQRALVGVRVMHPICLLLSLKKTLLAPSVREGKWGSVWRRKQSKMRVILHLLEAPQPQNLKRLTRALAAAAEGDLPLGRPAIVRR